MKQRLTILLLCAVLLSIPASASAGSAADPLISRSYIDGTFLPQAKNAAASAADAAEAEHLAKAENGPAETVLTLSAGQSVTLSEGQRLTLLSGAGNVYAERGELIDVTAGAIAANGAARRYSRYVAAEDSVIHVDLTGTAGAVVKVSSGAAIGTGSPFDDVTREKWFYSDVVSAVGRGLVDGVTDTAYVPDMPAGTLTGAQCVKLAACMHQLYRSGAVTLENSPSGDWYRSYVDYALRNGILDAELEDYDSPVAREVFVRIFYRALPEREYAVINTVGDNAIPDVAAGDPGAAQIYRFYRAGILSGYEDYSFAPASQISRAEVAAIMNRMFDPAARQRFTLT